MNARFNMSKLAPAFAFLLLMAAGAALEAQTYTVDWHKIAGGGGTSTNAQFTITGTIGQHDATATMSAGGFSVTGGFWSIINLVPTPGAPALTIVATGPNSVKVFWLDPAVNTFTLQQNIDASSSAWTTSGLTITSINGTNSVTLTPTAGNLFFRLKH
jgi:hypothetical protein